jgi:hypothetical protein
MTEVEILILILRDVLHRRLLQHHYVAVRTTKSWYRKYIVKYILVQISIYQYIPGYTRMNYHRIVCNRTYAYILVCTMLKSF